MGADSSLVTAARYYGATKAAADVPDMSKLYEGQQEITKTYLEGITDVFTKMEADEKARKAVKDTQLRAFKAQAAKARAHLIDQEASQPMKVHDAIYDKFKALEDEFNLYTAAEENDTPENEKMRANLYAQLGMITNQAVKSRGTIATKATMADSLVSASMTGQEIAIGRAIMGVDGNYDNVELSFNEKGELVYHVLLEGMEESVSWTIDDFNEKMVIHDNEIDTYQAALELSLYKTGFSTKMDFDREGQKSTFLKTVLKNDENIFKDVAFSEINGRRSWRNSLITDVNIAKEAIQHLFVEDVTVGLVDVNKDGVIDVLDYDANKDGSITMGDINSLSSDQKLLWQQNHELIVDALTNTKNPAFNFEVSSNMMADDFVDGLSEHFGKGRGDVPPPKRDKTTLTIPQQAERSRAINIDTLTQQENPSLLEMNKLIGGGGTRNKIIREGNEYIIIEREGKSTSELERFNVNDKIALRTYLYNYSGTDPFFGNQNLNLPEYEERKGDTIDNPIEYMIVGEGGKTKGGLPEVGDAEEGAYYKDTNTNKVYHFINDEFIEMGPVEIDEDEI